MISHRLVQQSLRTLATHRPSPSALPLAPFASPAAIAPYCHIFFRSAATTQPTPRDDAYHILERQRLNRPVSPHLSIYRPQITWYASALNRITGSILSGGFYVFGAAYLVAPLIGWHLESASLAAAFGALPVAVKFLTKVLLAWPFTFHSLNGIRHLIWDMGMQITNRQVARSGWAVVGMSTITAVLLAFL